MAEKRMLSRLVLDNDEFMEMPTEAQMLYVRLNLAADDRGICDSPRTVMKLCGASNDSMKLLISKKFILSPECRPSVIVIKHWWLNNTLRKERFRETKYTDVLSSLYYDDNKSYSQNPYDGHISCVKDGNLLWPTEIPAMLAAAVTGNPLPPPSVSTPLPDVSTLPEDSVTSGVQTGTQPAPKCTPDGCQVGANWVPQDNIREDNIRECNIDKYNTGKDKGVQGEKETPSADSDPPPDPGASGKDISYFGMKTREEGIEYARKQVQWFMKNGINTDIWEIRARACGIDPKEIFG